MTEPRYRGTASERLERPVRRSDPRGGPSDLRLRVLDLWPTDPRR